MPTIIDNNLKLTGAVVKSQAITDTTKTLKQNGRKLTKLSNQTLFNTIGHSVHFSDSNIKVDNLHRPKAINLNNIPYTSGAVLDSNTTILAGRGASGVQVIEKQSNKYISKQLIANYAAAANIYEVLNDGDGRLYATQSAGGVSKYYHNISRNNDIESFASTLFEADLEQDFTSTSLTSWTTPYCIARDPVKKIVAMIVSYNDSLGLQQGGVMYFEAGVRKFVNPAVFQDPSLKLFYTKIPCAINFENNKWYITFTQATTGTGTGQFATFEMNNLSDSTYTQLLANGGSYSVPLFTKVLNGKFYMPTNTANVSSFLRGATSSLTSLTNLTLPTACRIAGVDQLGSTLFAWGGSSVTIGSGNSILFKSIDDGATWTQVTLPTLGASGGFEYKWFNNGTYIFLAVRNPTWSNGVTFKFGVRIDSAGNVTELSLDRTTIGLDVAWTSATCYGLAYNSALDKLMFHCYSSNTSQYIAFYSTDAGTYLTYSYKHFTAGIMPNNKTASTVAIPYNDEFIVFNIEGMQYKLGFDSNVPYLVQSAFNLPNYYSTVADNNAGKVYLGDYTGNIYKVLSSTKFKFLNAFYPQKSVGSGNAVIDIKNIPAPLSQILALSFSGDIKTINPSNDTITDITTTQFTGYRPHNSTFKLIVADTKEIILLYQNGANAIGIYRALNNATPANLNFIHQNYQVQSILYPQNPLTAPLINPHCGFAYNGYIYLVLNFISNIAGLVQQQEPLILKFQTKTTIDADSTNDATVIKVNGCDEPFINYGSTNLFTTAITYKIFKNADLVNGSDIAVICSSDHPYGIVIDLKTDNSRICKISKNQGNVIANIDDTSAFLIDPISSHFKKVSLEFDSATEFQLPFDLKNDLIK